MRILTRYLVRELSGPFFFGVAAFTCIIVGFSTLNIVQQPMLTMGIAFRLVLLAIPENLSVAFPMGILLGTLFCLGRLSGSSEIVAMRAGGFPALRIMVPFVFFGFIASCMSLFLTQVVIPVSHRASKAVLAEAYGNKGQNVLRQKVLPAEYDRVTGKLKRLIAVGEFDLKELYLRDVYIWEFSGGRERVSVHADEMAWDGKTWQFRKGEVTFLNADGSSSRLTVNGGRAAYQPLLPKPKEISISASDPLNMSWSEYRDFIKRRAAAGENIRRFLVDLYLRLALPFACLALALVGTPLGIQSHRSGTAISFGLALVILVFYFMIMSFAGALGRNGVIPPILAAWAADIVVSGIGVGLFWKRMQ